MKVLIVSHYFLPHIGGIEQVVYHQAKELIRMGNQVTIITSNIPPQPHLSYLGKIKIFRVKVINFMEQHFGIPYPLFSPQLCFDLVTEIPKHDLVHVHGHMYVSSLLACLVAKIYRKKIILTQQNTFIESPSKYLCAIEHIVDKTIGFLTLKSADAIICASMKTKKYVQSIRPNLAPISVLYNGVDIVKFHPSNHKSTAKKKLHLNGKFVCFTFRRITFKNGINLLLDFATLLKDNPRIVFLLGGTGPDLPEIQKYITKHQLTNIIITGFIKDQDRYMYYQAADIFILPSNKGEGLPLVVLEAFASGVPVIATRSGGHEEIIKNKVNGFLVPIQNPHHIVDKINELSQHPKLLHQMSYNCRQTITKGFSWSTYTKEIVSIYKRVLP